MMEMMDINGMEINLHFKKLLKKILINKNKKKENNFKKPPINCRVIGKHNKLKDIQYLKKVE